MKASLEVESGRLGLQPLNAPTRGVQYIYQTRRIGRVPAEETRPTFIKLVELVVFQQKKPDLHLSN